MRITGGITGTLTRRGLAANKWRLLLTAVAVVLGVGFVSGSFMLRDSLKNVFGDLASEINAGVDVQVRTKVAFGDPAAANPVPAALVADVAAVDGVDLAVGDVGNVWVTIVGPDGKAKTPAGAPTIGLAWGDDEDLSPLRLVAGRRPVGDGEVAFDREAAERSGYAIGDRVVVVLPDGRREFVLTGAFRFGDSNSLAGAYLVAFDPAVASQVLGLGGDYSAISVRAVEGVADAELAERIGTALPDGFEAVTNAEIVQETEDQFGGFIDGFAIALLVFAGIALFVSAFIINNTFQILASQRLRELALLRAIGASTGQVRTMMAAEALGIGVVASILGLGVGVLLALGIKALIGAFAGGLPGGLVVSPTPIVAGLGVGIGVTLASALAPAIRAGQVPPVAAMSGTHAFSIGNPRRRLVLALGVTLVGTALFLIGLFVRPGSTNQWLITAGVGAAMLFLGVAGLSRLVVRPTVATIGAVLRPATRALTAPIRKLRGRRYQPIVARLANESVVRTPRRTAAAAAALMIGIAFVATGTVVGASMKQTLRDQLKSSIQADLFIRDPQFGPFTTTVTDRIAEIEGIDAVSGFKLLSFQVDGDRKDAGAVDHTTFDRLVDVGLQTGSWADLGPGAVFVHTDPAADLDLQVGDEIAATFQSTGTTTLTVAGIFDDASITGNWIVDNSTYAEHVTGATYDFFAAARLAPGASLDVKDAVATLLLDEAPNVRVQDKDEFRKSQEQQIDILLVVINVLLGLAVGIALIGIANTLALSVFERTRELGLMRAVGMHRAQIKAMVRWESVLVAVFGALLGIALGVALGAVVAVALPSAIATTVRVPVGQLAGYALASIVAGTFAAYFPARRAARMDVLDAITHT